MGIGDVRCRLADVQDAIEPAIAGIHGNRQTKTPQQCRQDVTFAPRPTQTVICRHQPEFQNGDRNQRQEKLIAMLDKEKTEYRLLEFP